MVLYPVCHSVGLKQSGLIQDSWTFIFRFWYIYTINCVKERVSISRSGKGKSLSDLQQRKLVALALMAAAKQSQKAKYAPSMVRSVSLSLSLCLHLQVHLLTANSSDFTTNAASQCMGSMITVYKSLLKYAQTIY